MATSIAAEIREAIGFTPWNEPIPGVSRLSRESKGPAPVSGERRPVRSYSGKSRVIVLCNIISQTMFAYTVKPGVVAIASTKQPPAL